MSTIFPGMDPYLEEPLGWPSLHSRFVVYLADELQSRLQPRYVASVEQRVYLEGPDRQVIPEVWLKQDRPAAVPTALAVADADAPLRVDVQPLEVRETYVAVLDLRTRQRVVTVIELTSPSNKYAGAGRDSYVEKQKEVLASETHLVEIDLLRFGPHVLAVPEYTVRRHGSYYYLVSVNRARPPRSHFELYPRRLAERLPRFALPLAEGDPDIVVDLQKVFAHAYDAGGYRYRTDYNVPCDPPLSREDQDWANDLIRQATQSPPAPNP
jgi:hypothetical protein